MMLFLILRAQRPLKFLIGPFGAMSLETFITVFCYSRVPILERKRVELMRKVGVILLKVSNVIFLKKY